MRVAIFVCVMAVFAGCGAAANKCLQTPASSKISDESVSVCKAALETDHARQDVFQRYMDILRVRGEHTDVVKWSLKIWKMDKGRTDALYNLAVGLRKVGRCKKAVKAYKLYAKKNASDPDPYFGMALCHEDLGDRAAAVEAYGQYIELEKRKSQQEWVGKARTRIIALRGGAVAPAPAPAPRTTPAPAPAPKPAPAPAPAPAPKPKVAPAPAPKVAPAPAPVPRDCSVHVKAFTANPFDTGAYDKYAVCSLAQGKHAEVIKRIRIALRDNPDYTKGWYRLGLAYKAAGNTTRAAASFKKACAAGVKEACTP